MPAPTLGSEDIMFCGRTFVRPSTHHLLYTYITCRDISLLSGWISMKLDTNIRSVNLHC